MRRSLFALFVFLAHLIGFAGSSVQAQVVTFFGNVTESTGIYQSSVSLGDPVTLQFQVTNLDDAFDGAFAPDEAAYPSDFSTLLISGLQRPLPNAFVYILSGPTTNGVFGNHTWNGFPFADGGFSFFFESLDDVITSLDYYPPGLPISDFFVHSGHYFTEGAGTEGSISWDINGYSGSFGSPVAAVSAVPEPSTYGLLAALALFGVAARRRFLSSAESV